jgi:AcrR family transcriptional regulator
VRVTKETQAETRQRILDAAQRLFRASGFEQATTRDIAREAGIATGTLFNYFPTKEAIVMTLVCEALDKGQVTYQQRRRSGATLEEDLFDQVACELRALKPHRGYLAPVLETAFAPVARSGTEIGEQAERVRVEHLEQVGRTLGAYDIGPDVPALAQQLYWTLYCGVLGYWARDTSSKQEDTLALLDQSVGMFVKWIKGQQRTREL